MEFRNLQLFVTFNYLGKYMPLYEYQCKECKKESEVLVRGAEQAECPACGSKKMEKLLSVSAAPSISGSSLPTTSAAPQTCGRPQCGSGCMFG